jgi:hypothetical protein
MQPCEVGKGKMKTKRITQFCSSVLNKGGIVIFYA